jgi:DNA modification methylase
MDVLERLRKLEVQIWPLDRLLPYARNARTHSDEQIAQVAASIVEFGWTNPILVGRDGVIIAGHARLAAARKLGIEEVPVILLDHLTETQRRALVLADNKLALNAGWDDEMLRVELEALKGDNFNLDIVGFSDAELDVLLVDPDDGGGGGLTDDDAAPAPQETAITVAGDVWILGAHRLLCGDATVLGDVEKVLAGKHGDMVFTDPPYGVAVASRTGIRGGSSAEARVLGTQNKIANDDLDLPALTEFLRTAFGNLLAATRKGACWYVTAPHGPMGLAFSVTLQEIDVWRHSLVWVKDALVMSRMDYHYRHEPIYYGWTPGAPHNYVPTRDQDTVWEVKRPKRSIDHPTMKPVELVERAVRNSSNARDIILDTFAGSGTTILACEKAGRQACAVELDPRYCDVIVRRWQEWTGKQARHEESGRPFEAVADGVEQAHPVSHQEAFDGEEQPRSAA